MAKLCVRGFAISLDGYAAGPEQDLEHPLGVDSTRLHDWVFETRFGRRMIGEPGGDEGIDDAFLSPRRRRHRVRARAGDRRGRRRRRPTRWWRGDDPAVPAAPGWSTRCTWPSCRCCSDSGERLFDHLDGGPEGYECVELVSSAAVTHVRLQRVSGVGVQE